jgi:hypothetical protein
MLVQLDAYIIKPVKAFEFFPLADGEKRRAMVLFPSGYLHPVPETKALMKSKVHQ